MGIIEKNTEIGKLYISTKTQNMALECNGEIISDQERVWDLLEENRIPVKAQFEITEKCNFNCYYCYAKSLRGQKDLSVEKVKKIIDKLDEEGIVFLELTGGEPLEREDFLEILKYINTKEFIVSLITNGSNINEDIVSELAKSNIGTIRLSLLSPVEESCDKLTGLQGSFKKTINGAKLLKENNINFYMSSVITRENIDMYDEYKKLEKETGIEIVYGIDVGPSFAGFKTVEKYSLLDEDFKKLKLYIDLESCEDDAELNCSAGKSKFAITNEGNIIPCLKVRNVVGNILRDEFDEVWQSQHLKEVMKKELAYDPKCKECDKKNYCHAYCPGEHKLYEDDQIRCRGANLMKKLIGC